LKTTTRGFSGILNWAFACDGPMVSLAQFGPFSSPSEQQTGSTATACCFFPGYSFWYAIERRQAIFQSISQSALSVHHVVVKIVSEQYKF
jgi:hypothetical protein